MLCGFIYYLVCQPCLCMQCCLFSFVLLFIHTYVHNRYCSARAGRQFNTYLMNVQTLI